MDSLSKKDTTLFGGILRIFLWVPIKYLSLILGLPVIISFKVKPIQGCFIQDICFHEWKETRWNYIGSEGYCKKCGKAYYKQHLYF